MSSTSFARRRPVLGALLALVLAACGETSVSEPIAPGTVTVLGATTRTGVVGRPLSEPVQVLVRGTDGEPLPGVEVTFATSGAGASVAPATVATDAQGFASTLWTLSTVAGANTLTASVGSGVSATVTATGSAGPPASAAATSATTLTAVAGTAVATPPSIRVLDAFGNPVPGAAVTFSVLSGGGTLTDFVRTTNAQGIAALGAWVLGGGAGQQVVLARVEQGGVTNSPVVFTATATAGAASQIVALSPTSQSAAAGTAATPPSVRVTDANGNPVPGLTVTFAVTAGTGQLTGATQTTNALGIATAGSWTLGNSAGANQVTASAAGAGSILFTATGAPGAATRLVIAAGNAQQAQISRPVLVPPTVVARDAFNNPVPGVVVTFAVASGGGTVIAPRQVTDATGTAAVGAWFLGPVPGANTLTASATGLEAVTFTATATPGTAVTMTPNSAIVQSGAAGAAVGDPPSVIVRDISGNPVPGVVVTFTVTAGNGTIVGSPATTDADGVAELTSWTLGPLVVPNTVVASSPGLPSITFTASPGAGAAATVAKIAGDNGAAVQGQPVSPQPTVRVTDANGNRVLGAIVTFAVTSGGGSITGATQATDAAGEATVGSWTLGSGALNRLTATVTGSNISGNPAVFTAQAATTISIVSAPAGPLSLATDFTITVRLRDAAGQAVGLEGVPLNLSLASGAGTLSGVTSTTTDALGQATFTIRITGAAGDRSFTISGVGLTSATTAVITFN